MSAVGLFLRSKW